MDTIDSNMDAVDNNMDTVDNYMATIDNDMDTIDNDMDTLDNDKSAYFWELSAPATALFIQEYHLGQRLLATVKCIRTSYS